jgi:N-terminal region of glycosyl transferase group 7
MQNSPAIFNKAAMMNIGFMEAVRMFPEMNCVMFHDVDHLLEDDRMLMNCGPQPHHYAFALQRWNYR